MKQLNFYFLWLLPAAVFFAGCHEPKKQAAATAMRSLAVAGPSLITSCPYFTRDTSGNPVLSWVQQDHEHAVPEVYYAVFSDSSQAFGSPRPVPPSAGVEPHGENMPKIIFREDGGILVVFGKKKPRRGNPYTGAVYYTQSFDGGSHWTPARPLVKDTAASFDQRYFDVARLPGGGVGIIWLNNSTPAGSTLYFARARGKGGFSAGKAIAQHTCQCCRTDLFVDSAGEIHAAWRGIIHDSIRDMVYTCSVDSGKTFSPPVRISPDNWVVDGCPHTGPSMAMNEEGLHFAWFTMGGGGGVYYCHSTNDGLTFSAREAVSGLASARHPQITALPGNGLAIVWDEGVRYGRLFHQRIGLQMRGPGGLLLGTRYLTPDSVNAAFPQIKPLNGHTALVAFTESSGNRLQVKYGIVQLE